MKENINKRVTISRVFDNKKQRKKPLSSVLQCLVFINNEKVNNSNFIDAAILSGSKRGEIDWGANNIDKKLYIKPNIIDEELTDLGKKTAFSIFCQYIIKKEELNLEGSDSFVHQVSQDFILIHNGYRQLVGIPHQHSAYSRNTRKIGHNCDGQGMRIYRSMSTDEWNNGWLRGHGGSFGMAMYHFDKKNNPKTEDNKVLVEFRINKKIEHILGSIGLKSEGSRSDNGKFGAKSEKSAVFGVRGGLFSLVFDSGGTEILNRNLIDCKYIAKKGSAFVSHTPKEKWTYVPK